jgi:ABC-type sugar transport system permease subunit
MSVINALQVFAGYYPLMNGQNESELDFIVVRIYKAAFVNYHISYAAALSWVLFVVIGLLTIGIFKTSKWVDYGEEA